MIEENNFNTTPVTELTINKKNTIALYYKLTFIITGLLMVLILTLGLILWTVVSNAAIQHYINWFNNNLPSSSQFKISIFGLAITVFVLIGLIIVLIIIPFLFIKVKNFTTICFSLSTFICSSLLLITIILFLVLRNEALLALLKKEDNSSLNTTLNLVICFLPWVLLCLFSFFLFNNSIILLVIILSNNTNKKIAVLNNVKVNIIAEKKVNIADIITTDEQPILTTSEKNEVKSEVLQKQDPAIIISNDHNHNLNATKPVIYDSKIVSEASIVTLKETQPITNTNKDNTIAVAAEVTQPTFENENQGGFEVKTNAGFNEDAAFNEQNITPNPSAISEESSLHETLTSITHETITKEKTKANLEWTLEEIDSVWEKAEIIDGFSSKLYRKDYSGALIFRDNFTPNYNEDAPEGTCKWTIVLHCPTSKGGTRELYNLDPMNIINAKSKGENYPRWTTKLSSKGDKNIYKLQTWKARS